MHFEDFEPIFGEPIAEWAARASDLGVAPPRRFLMHVFAPDYYHVKIQVTDFHFNSFETLLSVTQLEDLKDAVGIGGSWLDFVLYTIASLRQDARVVLDKRLNSGGATHAKLIAQKSKGMPLISIPLTKISDSVASAAMESMSFGLLKAYRLLKGRMVSDQAQTPDMTKGLSGEKDLLDKRQKLSQTHTFAIPPASPSSSQKGLEELQGEQVTEKTTPVKVRNRVVPAFRRAKVRGALLDDTDHDEEAS